LVSVDYTKGYGYIIEVEKKTEGSKRQEIKELLASRLEELGVALTPRDKFEKQYQYYKRHWKKLV